MPKFHPLCEKLADVLSEGQRAGRSGEDIAQDMIDAINASGVAWVAPWKMTALMHDAYNAAFKAGCSAGHFWSALRDAYLAEQQGD